MAGSLAAVALQSVDATFQQQMQRKALLDQAAVVLQQTRENPSLATSRIEARSQWNPLRLC
jgi:hypothetical protein